MKKLMMMTAVLTVASAQAGFGDFATEAASAVTGALNSNQAADQKQSARREGSVSRAVGVKPKAEENNPINEQKKESPRNVPGFLGEKYDWSYTDDWGSKDEYHTCVASGNQIERDCDGEYQIQQFRNENYSFSWIGFHSLDDLEYAVNQLDSYVNKCVEWEKVAIANGVEGLRKDDDKTKFQIDRDGNRVESFIFCTKKNKKGKIVGYFDVRWTDKHDEWLHGFNHVNNSGTIEFWQMQVAAFKKAVELYKTGLRETQAKEQKVKDSANLFN